MKKPFHPLPQLIEIQICFRLFILNQFLIQNSQQGNIIPGAFFYLHSHFFFQDAAFLLFVFWIINPAALYRHT